MSDLAEFRVHYEIYAPVYGALHGMLLYARTESTEEAERKFSDAEKEYLYVQLRLVTTKTEVIKSVKP